MDSQVDRSGEPVPLWMAPFLLVVLWPLFLGEQVAWTLGHVPRAVGVRGAPQYYRIQFGPTPDLARVESFTSLLSRSYGIVGRVVVNTRVTEYLVLSSPIPTRFAAEQRAALLRSLGIPSEVVRVTPAYRVHSGTFRTLLEAEARAREVRRRGFTAVVDPHRAKVYTVLVPRVPERVAGEVARRLRAEGFEVRLLPEP